MKTNTQHQIRVGIFVLFGIIATVVSILLLGGDRSFFTSFAHLKIIMPQAQGLNQGSVVSLSGINIGNVDSIDYSPQDNALVVMLRVKKSYLHFIKKDAKVEMRTQGALGDKYIYIDPGTPGSESVGENGTLQVNKSGDLLDMLASRGNEAQKIFEVINETLILIKSVNDQAKVEKIMTNMVTMSADLKETAKYARQILAELPPDSGKNLKESAEHLSSLLGKIDRGEGTLGALVNDKTLYKNLKSTFANDSQSQYMKSVLRTSIKQEPK